MSKTDSRSAGRDAGISRRRALAGIGAGGAVLAAGTLAMPRILHAQETIKVGILQPFSGGLEVLGEQGRQGAVLALEEANDAGGVLGGRKFEIIVADDKTDPKTAVERTAELIQRDKVTAIIGPVTSANRDAIQPTIERFKTPLLYATDYEGGVCSRYISCYSALPAHWVNPFIPYVKKTYGDQFYLFGSDYVWPRKMNEAIRTVADAAGATVLAEDYTPFGVKDFTTTVRKIESSGATVVVLSVVGADAITFVKQFTAAGLKTKCKIAWFGFSENYLPGLSKDESEGIVAPANFIATLDRPEAKAFGDKVRAKFGDKATISNTVDAHYNLTRFFIGGITRSESDDREKITDAMVDQTLMSGNGEVYLRPSDRHTDLNVLIAGVKDGLLLLEKDVGRVDAPSQCAA
jgi:branched-chain amino acid transport system substrate-binding protein/urea transport system substrate-binding protein